MGLEWQPVDTARRRLEAKRIQQPIGASPLDTVTHLTAMQGHNLPGVLWSFGLRTPGVTEAGVRVAFDRRELVRSWPMRGALHVTTPDDLRMILPLSRHRLTTAFATRASSARHHPRRSDGSDRRRRSGAGRWPGGPQDTPRHSKPPSSRSPGSAAFT
jgi:hypothetical protein